MPVNKGHIWTEEERKQREKTRKRNQRKCLEFLIGDIVHIDKTDSWGWDGNAIIVGLPVAKYGHRFKCKTGIFTAERKEITLITKTKKRD